MRIIMNTVEQEDQRYPTIGDYYVSDLQEGLMQFATSKQQDERYEFLILLHEFVEAMLLKFRGISWKEIDNFDIEFENNNKDNDKEPGDDKNAPYYHEHQFATLIERMVCQEIGIDWQDYMNDTVGQFYKESRRG